MNRLWLKYILKTQIMMSSNEGFSYILTEDQSFGYVPLVHDNYPWLVNKSESRILIPPFEVDKMAKEVISLAQDNIRQEQLMQAALDNANQFVLEKVGKQWIEFFDYKLKNL